MKQPGLETDVKHFCLYIADKDLDEDEMTT